MNKKGERGSSYLKPLEGVNLPKWAPSRRIEKEEVVIHCLIHWIQVGLKPNNSRILSKKPHSIKSKAFSISSFKAIRPPLKIMAIGYGGFEFCYNIMAKIFMTINYSI
jgi:hypothetical protein